jgi:C_GCAxxG_C_C family probable redox protein
MQQQMSKQEAIDRAQMLFDEGYACAQAIVLTFAEQYGLDIKDAALISSTFGGGMGRLREKCGAVTGGFMVLGLAYGNDQPKNMDKKLAAYGKVQELNAAVEKIFSTTICKELLQKHATEAEVEERKHHVIICRKVIGETAGILYDMLNTK